MFAGSRGDTQCLYARNIDESEARPLEGTDGARLPTVSPDGKWIAFWAARKIRKMPAGGGPVVDLASDIANPSSMAWDDAGNLFFGRLEDGRI